MFVTFLVCNMFNNYNNTGAQMLGSIKIILKSLFGCESINILPYM